MPVEVVDEVEEIPNDHQVSRHIFRPHKFDELRGVVWENAFMFSGGSESVIWRKYKPELADVHTLGCEQQARKKSADPEKDYAYRGCLSAAVGAVRSVKTKRGCVLSITHDPSDGQGKHHAELRRVSPDGGKLKPNDKSELLVYLKHVFGNLEPHSCFA